MAYMEINITGLKELGEKLNELGPKIARRGLRVSAYAGAAVVRDAARQTSAFVDRTGTLRRNIVVAENRLLSIAGKQSTYSVIVRKGKKLKYANTSVNRRLRRVGKKYTQDSPVFYGRFLEFGTSKMIAHSWLRPAFWAKQDEVVEAIRARLSEAVADAIR